MVDVKYVKNILMTVVKDIKSEKIAREIKKTPHTVANIGTRCVRAIFVSSV